MAHGVTLALRWIKRPPARWIHKHPQAHVVRTATGEVVGYRKPGGMTSHVNPEKDRSLAGKARIRARRAMA